MKQGVVIITAGLVCLVASGLVDNGDGGPAPGALTNTIPVNITQVAEIVKGLASSVSMLQMMGVPEIIRVPANDPLVKLFTSMDPEMLQMLMGAASPRSVQNLEEAEQLKKLGDGLGDLLGLISL